MRNYVLSFIAGIVVASLVLFIYSDQIEIAKGTSSPPVTFNQNIIEQLRNTKLDFENKAAIFEKVFGSLPSEVKVFPTENYYYFKFFANSGDIWGNMRLDSIDREEGVLSFAYFYVSPNGRQPYYQNGKSWHKNFTEKDGLTIKKKAKLTYDLTYKGKTVRFQLNNLKQKLPKKFKTHPGEKLVGRMCDESGFQFFLMFNEKVKAFYYVLDETINQPDILHPYGKGVYVGQLSGFGFYDELEMDRKILFAVGNGGIKRNDYYDGPFDQLPDNFVDADEFEKMVGIAYPYFKDKVIGRGDFKDKNGERNKNSRISISAYIRYIKMSELWSTVVDCEKRYKKKTKADVIACLAQSAHHKKPRQKLSYRKQEKKP